MRMPWDKSNQSKNNKRQVHLSTPNAIYILQTKSMTSKLFTSSASTIFTCGAHAPNARQPTPKLLQCQIIWTCNANANFHAIYILQTKSMTSTLWTHQINLSISDATTVPQPKSTTSQTIDMASGSMNFDLQCECPEASRINRQLKMRYASSIRRWNSEHIKYTYQIHMRHACPNPSQQHPELSEWQGTSIILTCNANALKQVKSINT